jgi:hypothetical protein
VKRRRRLGIAALAVVLPVILGACQPGQAGAAAFVGPNRLGESVVQDSTKATISAMGSAAAANVQDGTVMDSTVQRWIRHELANRAASDKGVTVTSGEVDALINQSLGTTGRPGLEQSAAEQAYVPPDELDQYAHDVLLERKLAVALAPNGTPDQQQAALLAEYQQIAKDVGVKVSPRYGAFDPLTLKVVPAPNDLSVPAVSAEPSALPSSS